MWSKLIPAIFHVFIRFLPRKYSEHAEFAVGTQVSPVQLIRRLERFLPVFRRPSSLLATREGAPRHHRSAHWLETTTNQSHSLPQRSFSVANSHQKHDSSNRGFASMDAAKQREIASKGGHAAHEKGAAHEFDSAEAREAGRKGGEAVSKDREHMAEIGREGGESRGSHSHRRGTMAEGSSRGSSHEQHVEAGRMGGEAAGHERHGSSNKDSHGMRGGSREQHAEAGRQSHKNE
jgi:general stress protein YciG